MQVHSVSVVIPTYNYGRYVTEAVDSVLAQTWRPLEIIVVDDGSTDDTRDRLRAYGDDIRYVYQENQGLSAARNTGIRAARGEWIALLDSDDLWHPRKLEAQARYLANHPEVALLASQDVTDLAGGWPLVELSAPPATLAFSVEEIAVRSRFGPSGVLIRRDCFDRVGMFDTSLRSAEDRDMWVRIASRFPVVRMECPLWWYRQHSGNMSSAAVRMETNELRVLRRALASIPSLRNSVLLKLKVLGYTAKSAAYRYNVAGRQLTALQRILRSMLLWPIPFRRDEANTAYERPKMLVLFVVRLVRSWFRKQSSRVIRG